MALFWVSKWLSTEINEDKSCPSLMARSCLNCYYTKGYIIANAQERPLSTHVCATIICANVFCRSRQIDRSPNPEPSTLTERIRLKSSCYYEIFLRLQSRSRPSKPTFKTDYRWYWYCYYGMYFEQICRCLKWDFLTVELEIVLILNEAAEITHRTSLQWCGLIPAVGMIYFDRVALYMV
jgi:hypothetical protein